MVVQDGKPEEPKQLSQMEMKRVIDEMHKEKKEKAEEKKRVHCKFISEIDCVNVGAIIEHQTLSKKDNKERPCSKYCVNICMPHVLPMHQKTATFQAMVTLTRQFAQLNQAIIQGVKFYEGQLVDTGLLPRPQIKPPISSQIKPDNLSKPLSKEPHLPSSEKPQTDPTINKKQDSTSNINKNKGSGK